jgi:hypothetical protein
VPVEQPPFTCYIPYKHILLEFSMARVSSQSQPIDDFSMLLALMNKPKSKAAKNELESRLHSQPYGISSAASTRFHSSRFRLQTGSSVSRSRSPGSSGRSSASSAILSQASSSTSPASVPSVSSPALPSSRASSVRGVRSQRSQSTRCVRARRPHRVYTYQQETTLNDCYREIRKPDKATKNQLAASLGLPLDYVNVWFVNARRREHYQIGKVAEQSGEMLSINHFSLDTLLHTAHHCQELHPVDTSR